MKKPRWFSWQIVIHVARVVRVIADLLS